MYYLRLYLIIEPLMMWKKKHILLKTKSW